MDEIGETFIDFNDNMDPSVLVVITAAALNTRHALVIIRLMRMMPAVNVSCSHQRMME